MSSFADILMNALILSTLFDLFIHISHTISFFKEKYCYYTNYFGYFQLKSYIPLFKFHGLIGCAIAFLACLFTETFFTDVHNYVISLHNNDTHFSTSISNIFFAVIIVYKAKHYIYMIVLQIKLRKILNTSISTNKLLEIPKYILNEMILCNTSFYTKDYLSNRSSEDINQLAVATCQNLLNYISKTPTTIIEKLNSKNLNVPETIVLQDINVFFCLRQNWHLIDNSKLSNFILKNSETITELFAEALYVARMYKNCTYKNFSLKRKSHIVNKCNALKAKQQRFVQNLNCEIFNV